MNISFFAEFPDEELDKLALIDFPLKVYLAANSLEEFREYAKKVKEIKHDTELAYWPLLEKSYWVSPYSYNRELDRLHKDLSSNEEMLEVLLDLELPKFWLRYLVMHTPRVVANALKYHLKLRKPRIKELFRNSEKYNVKLSVTSYPVTSKFFPLTYLTFKIFGFMGLHYCPRSYSHKIIYMCYSSIRKDLLRKTLKNIFRRKPSHRVHYQVGLGLLDYGLLSRTGFINKLQMFGILRKFELLSPKALENDLALVDEYELEDVTIYGLGGLDEHYVEVIRRFNMSTNSTSLEDMCELDSKIVK